MAIQQPSFGNRLVERASDFIWPRIIGSPEPEPQRDPEYRAIRPELIDEIAKNAQQRLEHSERSIDTVNAKLMSLFRLTTLLSTATIAILVGASQLNDPDDKLETWITRVVVFCILYAFSQLMCAVLATISGLNRSAYVVQTKARILPHGQETPNTYKSRHVIDILHMAEQRDWVTNRKVEKIAIAHTALINASLPLAGILISAAILALA